MAKPSPWSLVVQRTERITPNMQRITFGGALEGFPVDIASAYLKLMFPLDTENSANGKSVATRSYTVRRFDPDAQQIEMDFVVHGDHGIACAWAAGAAAGDEILAGGPGPKKLLNLTGEWYLIIGDMSALPAIGANLAHLPADATGTALIEILDAADQQELTAPSGVDIQWLVNPDPARSIDIVMNAVRALDWSQAQCEAWVAGELDVVRSVRSFLKDDKGMQRQQMYASSYWQHGSTDEQHRVAKKSDSE